MKLWYLVKYLAIIKKNIFQKMDWLILIFVVGVRLFICLSFRLFVGKTRGEGLTVYQVIKVKAPDFFLSFFNFLISFFSIYLNFRLFILIVKISTNFNLSDIGGNINFLYRILDGNFNPPNLRFELNNFQLMIFYH